MKNFNVGAREFLKCTPFKKREWIQIILNAGAMELSRKKFCTFLFLDRELSEISKQDLTRNRVVEGPMYPKMSSK